MSSIKASTLSNETAFLLLNSSIAFCVSLFGALPLKIQYYIVNSYKDHQTSQHFAGMHAKRALRRFDIFVAKRYT